MESILFRAQKERLGVSAKRLDEFLEGITWALSNRPDMFYVVEPGISVVSGVDNVPYIVWYTYDDTQVTLLAIEKDPNA